MLFNNNFQMFSVENHRVKRKSCHGQRQGLSICVIMSLAWQLIFVSNTSELSYSLSVCYLTKLKFLPHLFEITHQISSLILLEEQFVTKNTFILRKSNFEKKSPHIDIKNKYLSHKVKRKYMPLWVHTCEFGHLNGLMPMFSK